MRDGCYAHRHPNLSQRPSRFPLRVTDSGIPKLEDIARASPHTPTTKERWGIVRCENPAKLFNENPQGYIGFHKAGKEGGLYAAHALDALAKREGIDSYHIDVSEDQIVATFIGQQGTTLHVVGFDNATIVHGYGTKQTDAARRRIAQLKTPNKETSLIDVLDIPLFEYMGDVLGIRKAYPHTLFKEGTVGILQTQEREDIEKAVEAFFADDDISIIRVNENGEMEIRGEKHTIRIQQNRGTYTLIGYDPQTHVTPAASKVIEALPQIHIDTNPRVTFSKDLEVKVEHSVVTGYGVHVAYDTRENVYYVSPVASRRIRKPNTHTRTTTIHGEIEPIPKYMRTQITRTVVEEFKPGEAREIHFAGARFYRDHRKTTEGYEECIAAYQQAIADGICTALQSMHNPHSQNPQYTEEDAEERWNREHCGPRNPPHRDYLKKLDALLSQPAKPAYDLRRDEEKGGQRGRRKSH